MIRKVMGLLTVFLFSFQTIFINNAFCQTPSLSGAAASVGLSESIQPVMIRGMKLNPENGLNMSFIIDSGSAVVDEAELQKESEKLIKYFLAALTIPEKDLWVNLSPYEKERIIADGLGKTEMGRDMLALDYMLKQMTSALLNPEGETGKEFWNKVHTQIYEKYGQSDLPVDSLNKVWIMPQTAEIFAQADTVLIINSRMKVMLEGDYLATDIYNSKREAVGEKTPDAAVTEDVKRILREAVIPVLEQEVNEGEHFAQLRQIYHSLLLAKWYKDNLKTSILNRVYSNQEKVSGVDHKDANVINNIYDQYVEAFRKGSEGLIKEDYDPQTQALLARKYITGGERFDLMELENAVTGRDFASLVSGSLFDASTDLSVQNNLAMLDVPKMNFQQLSNSESVQHFGEEASKIFREKFDAIKSISLEQVTFENTFEAFDQLERQFDEVALPLVTYAYAHRDSKMSKTALEQFNSISMLKHEWYMDADLFQRFKQLHEQRAISDQRFQIIQKRFGVVAFQELNTEQKDSLLKIQEELAQLEQKTKPLKPAEFFMSSEEFQSLPDELKSSFQENDGKITGLLRHNIFDAILLYSPSPQLRKRAYEVFYSNNDSAKANDYLRNFQLRQQFVKDAGLPFSNYAEYALTEEVVSSPDALEKFVDEIDRSSKPVRELEESLLLILKRDKEGEDAQTIYPWDQAFYFNLLTEQIEGQRKKISLEDFLNSIWGFYQKTGLSVQRQENSDVWHPDVQFYVVSDQEGNVLGSFYLDPFADSGKRGSSLETGLPVLSRNGKVVAGGIGLVLGSVVKAHNDPKEIFLTRREEIALAHEIGHLVERFIARPEYMLDASESSAITLREIMSTTFEHLYGKIEDLNGAFYQDYPLTNRSFKVGYPPMFYLRQQMALSRADLKFFTSSLANVEQMDAIAQQYMNPMIGISDDLPVRYYTGIPQFTSEVYGGRISAYLIGLMQSLQNLAAYKADSQKMMEDLKRFLEPAAMLPLAERVKLLPGDTNDSLSGFKAYLQSLAQQYTQILEELKDDAAMMAKKKSGKRFEVKPNKLKSKSTGLSRMSFLKTLAALGFLGVILYLLFGKRIFKSESANSAPSQASNAVENSKYNPDTPYSTEFLQQFSVSFPTKVVEGIPYLFLKDEFSSSTMMRIPLQKRIIAFTKDQKTYFFSGTIHLDKKSQKQIVTKIGTLWRQHTVNHIDTDGLIAGFEQILQELAPGLDQQYSELDKFILDQVKRFPGTKFLAGGEITNIKLNEEVQAILSVKEMWDYFLKNGVPQQLVERLIRLVEGAVRGMKCLEALGYRQLPSNLVIGGYEDAEARKKYSQQGTYPTIDIRNQRLARNLSEAAKVQGTAVVFQEIGLNHIWGVSYYVKKGINQAMMNEAGPTHGGIDFDTSDMTTKTGGKGIEINIKDSFGDIDPAMIQGIVPVNIRLTPISVGQIFGKNESEEKDEDKDIAQHLDDVVTRKKINV